MSGINTTNMAGSGTTGNNTHQSVGLPAVSSRVAYKLVCEVAGGTPTITWKIQVSADDTGITDANSTWYDLLYFTPTTNDTAVTTTRVVTAVGSDVVFPDTAGDARFWRKARLVTTANTNITYRGEAVTQYRN